MKEKFKKAFSILKSYPKQAKGKIYEDGLESSYNDAMSVVDDYF